MAYTYENKKTLVETGDYEARLENVERKTLPSGTEKLSLTWRIRDDVEQKYKNKVMFEDIWREKESPEHFNRKRINQLLGTQDVKEGTIFETINDIINFVTGKCAVIHIVTAFDEYRGEDVNKVAYYKSSSEKPKKVGEPSPKKDDVAIVVSDDDLPF